MKRIVQLVLLLALSISILIAYNYFHLEEDKNLQTRTLNFLENDFKLNDQKDNLIKNLKYNANVNNDDQYTIVAKLSETLNDSGVEFVDMKEVEAFYKKKNTPINITSNSALFNSSNYNTNFYGNIIITYLTYRINSDEMKIDFDNNTILISKNVNVYNQRMNIKADNVKIYLDKKEIEIYMEKKKENIKINYK